MIIDVIRPEIIGIAIRFDYRIRALIELLGNLRDFVFPVRRQRRLPEFEEHHALVRCRFGHGGLRLLRHRDLIPETLFFGEFLIMALGFARSEVVSHAPHCDRIVMIEIPPRFIRSLGLD